MTEIERLASGVDDAIRTLERAIHAFEDASLELNAAHYRRHNNSHPRYERPGNFVRAAVASRQRLARTLDLLPNNPPITVLEASSGVPAGSSKE
jgi:hypothetical protein